MRKTMIALIVMSASTASTAACTDELPDDREGAALVPASVAASLCAGCNSGSIDGGELVLPGVSWTKVRGAPTLSSDGLWSFERAGDAVDELAHELVLPDGATITTLQVHVRPAPQQSASQIWIKLMSRAFANIDGTTPTPITEVLALVPSAGNPWIVRDLIATDRAGVGFPIASGTAYWLSVGSSSIDGTSFGTAPLFDGARVAFATTAAIAQ